MVQKINRRQAQANAANQNQERIQKQLSTRGKTQKKIDQTKGSTYNEIYYNESDTDQLNPLQRTVNNMQDVGTMGPMTGAQGAGALDDQANIAGGRTLANTAQVNDTAERNQRRDAVNYTNTQNTLNFDNQNYVGGQMLNQEVQQTEREIARLEAQKKLNPGNEAFIDYAINQQQTKLDQATGRQKLESEAFRNNVEQAQAFREGDTAETTDIKAGDKTPEATETTEEPYKGEAQAQMTAMAASLPPEWQGYAQQWMSIGQADLQRSLKAAADRKALTDQQITQDFQADAALIAELAQASASMYEFSSQMAEKDRLRQAERIERDKKQALEEQAFEDAQELKDANKKKKQLVEDNVQELLRKGRVLALSGAGGSGAALGALEDERESLRQTEDDMDEMISDLRRSQDIDRKGLLNKFLGAYTEVESAYDTKVAAAVNQYHLDLKDTKTMTRSTIQSRDEKRRTAENVLTDSINAGKTDWKTQVQTLLTKQYDAMQKEKDRVYTQKQNEKTMAFNMFTDAFNNSTDPVYRSRALEIMSNAGYNVQGMDVNSMSLDQQLKALDMAKKQKELQDTNPYSYNNPEERELMNAATLVAKNGSDDYKQSLISQVADYVKRGDLEGARKQVEKIAIVNLNETQRKNYTDIQSIQDESDLAIAKLEEYAKEGKVNGLYKMKWNKAKKLFAKSQDPEFLELTATMAGISAEEIKSKSGAAVSEQEFERLRAYIPQSDDTVLDALTKMRKLKSRMNTVNSNFLRASSGLDTLSGESEEISTSQPEYNNTFFDTLIFGGGEGGEETASYESLGSVTQSYATPIASREKGGLYDQFTVDAWGSKHAGLDVAMPENTKLPSLVNGEVVEVGNTKGWGKTVVIKDSNGGLHRLSHLNGVNVNKGDTVTKGQKIALSGNTGNSTGPHLDYRIKVGNDYVDPSSYQYS